jgi:hypothetical protein
MDLPACSILHGNISDIRFRISQPWANHPTEAILREYEVARFQFDEQFKLVF